MEYHSGGSLPLLGRPRYCPGANANGGYLCETGHCCGDAGCCTYYYELWWFWLLWTALIVFSCCCAYRHKRAKLRLQQQQQQQQQQQRQRQIHLLACPGAGSYPSSTLDLSFLASLKLPSYEEVAAQPPTPPPPYSSVFTTPRYPQPPRIVNPHLLTQHDPLLHQALSDGPSSFSSDNSSSCSCDSCCPSSPCSSSLSAPVTYETDTSHVSTPSRVTPLTLDVAIEVLADAAAQEPAVTDSWVSAQTVALATAATAAPPQSLPSPSAVVPPPTVTSALERRLTFEPCTSSCSPSPRTVDMTTSTEEPTELPPASTSAPSTPATSISDSPCAGTCDRAVSLNDPPPDVALTTGSAGVLTPDAAGSRVPPLAPLPVPTDCTQAADPTADGVPLADLPPLARPGSAVVLAPPSPGSALPPVPGTCPPRAEVPLLSAPRLVLSPETDCTARWGPRSPDPVPPSVAPSCPDIHEAPPPLEPLLVLHRPDKGVPAAAHASSLSPSPRATQSPPKRALFSPCVDVYEAEPSRWVEGEDEDGGEEDMGADESQYRHRRLTGDSGIEVCRCRMEEEGGGEGEVEEEEEGRGPGEGGGGEQRDGSGGTDLHDSVDCPVRGQTPWKGACDPSCTATPDGIGVIAVETV